MWMKMKENYPGELLFGVARAATTTTVAMVMYGTTITVWKSWGNILAHNLFILLSSSGEIVAMVRLWSIFHMWKSSCQ